MAQQYLKLVAQPQPSSHAPAAPPGNNRFCHQYHPLRLPGLQADHYDKGYTPRIPGERLSASYINHYKANGGAVLSKVGAAGVGRRPVAALAAKALLHLWVS